MILLRYVRNQFYSYNHLHFNNSVVYTMEQIKTMLFPTHINSPIPFSNDLICDINTNFSLPIEFLDDKHEVSDNIKNDIEINKVYEKMFGSSTHISKCIYEKMGNYTTNNIKFLKDSQTVIKNVNKIRKCDNKIWTENTDKLSKYWHDIYSPNFCGKYSFLEWTIFKQLNYSIPFLTLLSLSNMLSPLLFFIMPLILLMVPFVILKFQGIAISTDKYYDILKHIAKNHFIGKALTQINNLSFTSVVQIIFYIGMYLMQIYNNVQSCKKYYTDVITVNENINLIKTHVNETLQMFSKFKDCAKDCITYKPFIEHCDNHFATLVHLQTDLRDFKYSKINVSNVFEFGWVLKQYYKIYDDDEYKKSIAFSIGFTEYLSQLQVLNCNIGNLLNGAKFSNKKSTHMKKQRYPLIDEDTNTVTNDCDLIKNIIVTGANASGKTTFLKTTTINLIISQQIGFGFYKSATINPYTHFHTYLNIPDTSERDSLFQAESRRCKEIIDILASTSEDDARHFCIFDELYSGTNPDEASKSGVAFLTYLNRVKNLDYILTTHYVYICNKFKKSKDTENYKMLTTLDENGNCIFHYKIKKGISKVRGALSVLRQMNYPKDIIENIKTMD